MSPKVVLNELRLLKLLQGKEKLCELTEVIKTNHKIYMVFEYFENTPFLVIFIMILKFNLGSV